MTQFARALLEKTAAAPAMYASTKEVFIMRVATVLELHVKDFDVAAFYKKHVEMRGSAYVGLNDAPGLDWPRALVADALSMLT
jgi:hypothetical protein